MKTTASLLARVVCLATSVVLVLPAAYAAYEPTHYHVDPPCYTTYINTQHCQCNYDDTYRNHAFTFPTYSETQHKCGLCQQVDDHVYQPRSARCSVAAAGNACAHTAYTFPGGSFATETLHVCRTCGYQAAHQFPAPGSVVREVACTICGYVCAHGGPVGNPSADGHHCSCCGWMLDHDMAPDAEAPASLHACTLCGYEASHAFANGVCTTCPYACAHFFGVSDGRCSLCGLCLHVYWNNGKCVGCGIDCPNGANHACAAGCGTCGIALPHHYVDNGANHKCSVCNGTDSHIWFYLDSTGHACLICAASEGHHYSEGSCTLCGYQCAHFFGLGDGRCGLCGLCLHLNWNSGQCGTCGIDCPNGANHTCAAGCGTCGMALAHQYVDNGANHMCFVCSGTAAHGFVDQGAFMKCATCSHADYKPVGADDSVDCRPGRSVTIPVLANDRDPDTATITPVLQTQPAHGTATLSGSQVIYVPDPNWKGIDSFTYKAFDGLWLSAAARVTVDVGNARNVRHDFTVTTSVSPLTGGTVVGQGLCAKGSRVVLIATPAAGFSFVNWTENGNVVGTQPMFIFQASANRTLKANFAVLKVNKKNSR